MSSRTCKWATNAVGNAALLRCFGCVLLCLHLIANRTFRLVSAYHAPDICASDCGEFLDEMFEFCVVDYAT